MSPRSILRLASTISFFVLWPAFASAQSKPSDAAEKEALGKAAITAYAANIHSFPFYKCRYRHTKAQARSVEDAVQGKYLNAFSYDNRLLVDGERELYEGMAPPPDPKQRQPMPGQKGVFRVPARGLSDHYLADGKREMDYLPVLQAINLFKMETRARGIDFTPLGMQFVGHRSKHGPDARLRQTDRFEFSVDGLQEIDGRPVITARFKEKVTSRPGRQPPIETYIYSFDGSQGYLPIRMTMLRNSKPRFHVFVSDVRECSNQRWFPERSVVVDIPDKEGALYDVSELKLLELDADHHPNKSEFFFVIPAGTTVSHFGNPADEGYFTLKQDEKIHVDDLPTLFEMCEKAKNTPLMDTAIPHSSFSPWMRWSVGIAGLILVLGGTYYLVRRTRLKRGFA